MRRLGHGVEVTEKEKPRTVQQNALYWKWVEAIGNYVGYSRRQLHHMFKKHFLGMDRWQGRNGEWYEEPKSTTELNTKEFTEYLGKVEIYANQAGVMLPTKDYWGYE